MESDQEFGRPSPIVAQGVERANGPFWNRLLAGSTRLLEASVGCKRNRCQSVASSIVRGQSFLNKRDMDRSASTIPPVWHFAQ